MLGSRPEEQVTLFKEIMFRKITVREAERIARRIAVDKVRKKELIPNAELMQIEHLLQESLGTRVHIEPKEAGGKITIDYFSNEDLDLILGVLNRTKGIELPQAPAGEIIELNATLAYPEQQKEMVQELDDRDVQEKQESEEEVEDLYNLKNFSL